MSLFEKPHTVTIELQGTEAVPAGYESGPTLAASISMECQITPKSAGFALERYGVELSRPYKLMADPDDEPFLLHGAKVIWSANGRERLFHIRTPVRYHGQGDDCDHVSVMIEEDFGG